MEDNHIISNPIHKHIMAKNEYHCHFVPLYSYQEIFHCSRWLETLLQFSA